MEDTSLDALYMKHLTHLLLTARDARCSTAWFPANRFTKKVNGKTKTFIIHARVFHERNWTMLARVDDYDVWNNGGTYASPLYEKEWSQGRVKGKALLRDRAFYMDKLAMHLHAAIKDWFAKVKHCRMCHHFIREDATTENPNACRSCLDKCFQAYVLNGVKLDCAICLSGENFHSLDQVDLPIKLGCNHMYHRGCIRQVKDLNGTYQCPLCRKPYSSLSLTMGLYNVE